MSQQNRNEKELQKQLDASVEKFRLNTVIPEEMLARVNKASYEKMHYYLEGMKLIPEYEAAMQKAQDEARARAEAEKPVEAIADTDANTKAPEPDTSTPVVETY